MVSGWAMAVYLSFLLRQLALVLVVLIVMATLPAVTMLVLWWFLLGLTRGNRPEHGDGGLRV